MTEQVCRRLLWALVPILAACPQDLSVHVAPGATVEDLRFEISNYAGTSETGELLTFKVIELGGVHGPGQTATLWEISLEVSGAERVGEVRYGTPPEGFATEVAPSLLLPGGRYFATGGSAGVEFRVDQDGAVTAFDPADETDPFSASGLRQADVERFWDELRRSLEPPDPGLIADRVHYPLRVSGPDSSLQVVDRDELIEEFDAVFPPELRMQLLDAGLDEFVGTSRGVAVALGALWIGEACQEDTPKPCPPVIFEVNRYE